MEGSKVLSSDKGLTRYQTKDAFDAPEKKKKKPFENIVGKGENGNNEHFLLFQQCFLAYGRQI